MKSLAKIFLTAFLLAGGVLMVPKAGSAQVINSTGGGGSGLPMPTPTPSKAPGGTTSVIPLSTVTSVLQEASLIWGIPFYDLMKAYDSGLLIIIQTGPDSFTVIYDGSTLDLILDDM